MVLQFSASAFQDLCFNVRGFRVSLELDASVLLGPSNSRFYLALGFYRLVFSLVEF